MTVSELIPFEEDGVEGIGGCSLHNPAYDFNDDILCKGADFWVALVQDQLATA